MGVIILICGQAGSGKSTLARRLHDLLGAEIVPMAQQLKEDVATALGCHVMDLSLQDFKNRPTKFKINVDRSLEEGSLVLDRVLAGEGDTPRKIMQLYGTDVMRDSNPDYWVSQWCEKVSSMPCSGYIVADDVRFLNEISFVRAYFMDTAWTVRVLYIPHPTMCGYSMYAPASMKERYDTFEEHRRSGTAKDHASERELAYTAEQGGTDWYDRELTNIFGVPENMVVEALNAIK